MTISIDIDGKGEKIITAPAARIRSIMDCVKNARPGKTYVVLNSSYMRRPMESHISSKDRTKLERLMKAGA